MPMSKSIEWNMYLPEVIEIAMFNNSDILNKLLKHVSEWKHSMTHHNRPKACFENTFFEYHYIVFVSLIYFANFF